MFFWTVGLKLESFSWGRETTVGYFTKKRDTSFVWETCLCLTSHLLSPLLDVCMCVCRPCEGVQEGVEREEGS